MLPIVDVMADAADFFDIRAVSSTLCLLFLQNSYVFRFLVKEVSLTWMLAFRTACNSFKGTAQVPYRALESVPLVGLLCP